MNAILLSLHVLICFLVVFIVLIQSGKGAGFSGLLGGGSSDALFNAPSGSMFLRKLTTGLAVGFFATSVLLTYMSAKQRINTVTRSFPAPAGAALPVPAETQVPAAPAPTETPAQKK